MIQAASNAFGTKPSLEVEGDHLHDGMMFGHRKQNAQLTRLPEVQDGSMHEIMTELGMKTKMAFPGVWSLSGIRKRYK
jgi:hypothetical protein